MSVHLYYKQTLHHIEAAKKLVSEKGEAVKSAKAKKEDITDLVTELKKAKDDLTRLEETFKLKPGLPEKDGKIDYTRDFFARQAFLTVSGQLQDDINCAEEYVKFLCKWLLEHCRDDMEFMVKNFDKTAIDHLEMGSSTPFERITYTRAIELLKDVDAKVKTFEKKVEWGIDLASEHERYLTEVMFKKLVIVYNYPKDFKAFYMRLNDDLRIVAAMDVLVPKEALDIVQLCKDDQESTFAMLASVLSLGNISVQVIDNENHVLVRFVNICPSVYGRNESRKK
ncbi:hypothetical protein IFM89_001239 [Coptis chinensis]|uniref:Aminoacyl-tRNA synthetase class II (D/K/N) domain-containing protein n=1 Tax=Coptis chinensis TaxID=261450 RepID=A0A835H0Y1_9MAGN|nr:hypothetical protein IFM89_001239 [Coptis chinensis]